MYRLYDYNRLDETRNLRELHKKVGIKMEWLEISYHATQENYELVSQVFIDAGSKGVALEDSKTLFEIPEDRFGEVYRLNAADYPKDGVIVKGYLAVVPQVETTIERVKASLFNFAPESEASFTVTTLVEEDWAQSWKVHYQPIHVTENLVIKPSWLQKSNDDQIVEILLDPGMAFGSGTHATTYLCLQLLEKYISADSRVVDVGTGSGVLAITASKLGAKLVYGVDLDEMAVMRAKENVSLNECDVLIETNHLMDGVNALDFKPNLIIANILSSVIIGMLKDVSKVLKKGDIFICSGIIVQEKDKVMEALGKYDFKIVEICENNGWIAIVGRCLK